MCGEYGSINLRPHFHALLFNCDFPDKYPISLGVRPLFRSPELEKLWRCPEDGKSYGFSSIGDVTFESAAYVARYCTSKITGAAAAGHYLLPSPWTDVNSGEIFYSRVPEFNRMSLKRPIARDWLRLYWSDCREGKMVVNGKECLIPRYYRRYFKNSVYGEAIKCQAAIDGLARRFDMTNERLLVKEVVATSRFKSLSRSL